MYDIFVSYSTKDKNFADALVNRLENTGFRCWYAPRDIPAGVTWPAAITQAVRQSKVMLLIFSGSANSSQEVSKELTLASSNKRMVIPVRLEDILPSEEIEYHLTNRHWLDVFGMDQDKAITSIVENLKLYEDVFNKEIPATPPANRPIQKKSRRKVLILAVLVIAALGAFIFIREPALNVAGLPDNIGPGPLDYNVDVDNLPERGKYSMAYLGPQGVNVWIVRIGPESDNTYLICIRGIDSIWDNYVIYSRRDRVRGKERYVALIKGKPTIIMRVKDDKGWVYIPEENGKSLLVEYSDERSKKFYPDYFIRSYLYQVK